MTRPYPFRMRAAPVGRAVLCTPFSIRHFTPRRARSDAPYHSDARGSGTIAVLYTPPHSRLPTLLRSVAENKFCNRQIARVSDFQIKVVVKNNSDFVAASLDC
jgi:hypothetical protein